MESARLDNIRALFDAAVELPPDARAQFLAEACQGDAALRTKIEALLDCAENGYCVIDRPLITLTDRALAVHADHFPQKHAAPRKIGPYRIMREIGTGSMGTVYEAAQDTLSRTVAVKVLRACLSTASMLRRFEFEAQALGQLNHPYIARVFDTGTTETEDGPQPYIAMELVRGVGLVRFAQERNLSHRQRLELLADVCEAVQHAHQKGIIHRDLKPGNIIVDEDGRPHIVDFGVARAVEVDRRASTAATEMGELLGTLPYMSPEQAGGRPIDIDTRTDIYALGVIGFELLTGRLPHDLEQVSLTDAVMTIADATPPRLGTIDRTLRGDVEVIIAMAIEKDKSRRYQSASAFAADIRSFLSDRPIMARPPSLVYQLGKYARRNKASFTATATALLLLVLGIIGTSFGLVQAVEHRRIAEAQRQLAVERLAQAEAARTDADTAFKLLRRVLTSATPTRQGADVPLTKVVQEASAAFDDNTDESPVAIARIRVTLADTFKSLGEFALAEREIRKALSLLTEHLGPGHPDLLAATFNLAYLRQARGHAEEAAELYESTLETAARTVGPNHRSVLIAKADLAAVYRSTAQYKKADQLFHESIDRLRVSDEIEESIVHSALNNYALLCVDLGRYAEADRLFEQVLEGRERTLGADHPDTLKALGNRGYLYAHTKEYDKAEQIYRRVLDARKRILGKDHAETLSAMANLAVVLQNQARYAEAQALFETVVATRRRMLGDEHPATIGAMQNLNTLLRDQNKYAETEQRSRFILDVRRRRQGPQHPDTLLAMNDLATVCRELGRLDEAESLMLEAVDGARSRLGEQHARTLTLRNNLARLYQMQGRLKEAEELYRHVLDVRSRRLGDAHRNTILSRLNLATLLMEIDRHDEARPMLENCLEHAPDSYPDPHWITGLICSRLGQCLARESRNEEAEHHLIAGYEMLLATLGADHRRTYAAVTAIADFYESTGRPEEAARWHAREKPIDEAPKPATANG